ncbi:hypothetical protein YA0783_23060 [Pseudomonas corrugata]|uniref:hypothetical protein n=1 Tax=Pseudomonas corrugata TaxID=47879 RepID=UPI0018E60FE0|nr:hypothetical protein [Pseudomonas corrugata]MBI6621181.1 hypothetical protein [Pseudomonas corrugata]MBI6693747.1 hypothetical protein [Pseudomonas corrugata]
MNAFSVLSVIFTVISLIQIGLVLLVDESFIIAAMVNVLVSVYLDHQGIEKDLRDFLAEGRAKR